MASAGGRAAGPEVHTFWVGADLPAWVPLCVESYCRTGHIVNWWLYTEERTTDLRTVCATSLLESSCLRIRDASEIIPHSTAQRMYYHGIGPEGKWKGWAPFSDWFRYEVIARFGGWWVDADSISVRNLSGIGAAAEGGVWNALAIQDSRPIICTERHRLDRRSRGAVAVRSPYTAYTHGRDKVARVMAFVHDGAGRGPDGDGTSTNVIARFHAWRKSMEQIGLDVCLVSNNHFYEPRVQSEFMVSLAREMHHRMHRYAADVERLGIVAVRNMSKSGIPNGNLGMQLFQRAAKQLLVDGGSEPSFRPTVLHWSVFNPVDATDPMRMHRVLCGVEPLPGAWVRSIHMFNVVRERWTCQGLSVPPMAPVVSDAAPTARSRVQARASQEVTGVGARAAGALDRRMPITPLLGVLREQALREQDLQDGHPLPLRSISAAAARAGSASPQAPATYDAGSPSHRATNAASTLRKRRRLLP